VRRVWTRPAVADLVRLHDFLAEVSPRAADRTAKALDAAVKQLQAFPRLGSRVDGFASREVRRLIVGDYEMRYEVVSDAVVVLRIWHGREDR
jgi:plasmid stabilization system protein ParE